MKLVKENPEITWPRVPFDVKESIKTRINNRLKQEGIPEVEDDVLRWRMAGCIYDVQRPSA